RHDAGAACPPRSSLADTAEHRRWQTPGADAQILRASGRSPRETLVVCLVKRCRLTCSHYTIVPIMSKDFTVQTVQKAAEIAVRTGSRLYTDSASSYRAVKGYVHEFVNHTRKEYARGDVHENRAECLFSLLKPYLRVFRGLSKYNLPGYVGFFQ